MSPSSDDPQYQTRMGHEGPTIFLDIDGVLIDLVGAMLRFHGRTEYIDKWPRGAKDDIAKLLGMTPADFWDPIDDMGPDFWRTLPEYPWAKELYRTLCQFDPAVEVVFLSGPSWSPASAAGKLAWMQDFTGKRSFRNYVLTFRKDLLARPDAVLVDDREVNTEAFVAAGGKAVLFPQPWNGAHCDLRKSPAADPEAVAGYVAVRVQQELADVTWCHKGGA